MQNAVAFANNDTVMIAWSFGFKPQGCMGFAVYRITEDGKETPLPGYAVFKGIKPKHRTTEEVPVQKFYWKDPYARLIAEDTDQRKFRYKIVPMEGQPRALKPMKNLPELTTNEVELSAKVSDKVWAYFNRGLISTQRVSRAIGDKKMKESLIEHITDPKDKLRASLSGDMVEALTDFVGRAKNGGKIYAALYELKDEELIKLLVGLGPKLHIVLSNSRETEDATDEDGNVITVIDPKTGKKKTKKTDIDGNEPAREALAGTAAEKWDRIMPSNHIGHNKFLVHVDAHGKAQAVLTGSTNWTSTGLCAQTNNAIVVENPVLAARYLAYWTELAQDTEQAAGVPKNLQGEALRTWDAEGAAVDFDDHSAGHIWFSPNTPSARGKNRETEERPIDMRDLSFLISQARHSILFLAFYPGAPSVADWIGEAQKASKSLFARGCVTNVSAAESFYYKLVGGTPPARPKGSHIPFRQDWKVQAAEAFDGTNIPEGWRKEILNAGFAIIHDKVVVIDPFSPDCVVATGSHNLGYKASYDNDENLLIVRGNKRLAMAYATHVLDVYDHFSARYWHHHGDNDPDALYLKTDPDEWLQKYFDAKGQTKSAQLRFWMEATAMP